MSAHPKHQPHQIAIGEAIQTTITGEDVPARLVVAEADHNASTEPVAGVTAHHDHTPSVHTERCGFVVWQVGTCSCGWQTPLQSSRVRAFHQAKEHAAAENGGQA